MKRWGTILWAGGAIALFALAGLGSRGLSRWRVSQQAADRGGLPAGAPPSVALITAVLGGFRGILVDTLWLRAARLQEEGRYFELAQLAEWIAHLDPRNADIWSFHAWNLAYNISPLMPDLPSRWRWVENGLRLLRDEGLPLNRDRPELYFDLAWLFFHKIGGSMDPAASYFQWQWARTVEAVIPGGRLDYDRLAADAALRREIEKTLRLDPFLMHTVDSMYGPLDWRVACSHSLYWAWVGRRYAHGTRALLLQRLIYQSTAALFYAGEAEWRPEQEEVQFHPRPDLFDQARAAHEWTIVQYPDDEGVREAYRHFLMQAVRLFHRWGHEEGARRAHAVLRETYGEEVSGPSVEALVTRLERDEHRAGENADAPQAP